MRFNLRHPMWIGAFAVLAVPFLLMAADDDPTAEQREQRREKMKEMGEKMDLPHDMQMRMRALMYARLSGKDPAVALALKDHLKLTDEQAEKLKGIVEQARTQANEVLTPEQRDMLDQMKDTPETMKAFQKKMMEKMKEEGKLVYTCPMHPEVKQSEPGKCPTCNMDLEMAGCPMCAMKSMMDDKDDDMDDDMDDKGENDNE